MQRRITLRDITNLDVERQLLVREVRNHPTVRSNMYTDHEIGVNEHLAWIARLKADRRQVVFTVLEDEKPVGVASVNVIDRLHRKADWAFYLAPDARGGLGAALEMAMIEFAFGRLGLEKLNCEVIEGNEPVVKLHAKFGFKQEGFREQNILKGERRIGVYFLGLRKDQWDAETVRQRHEGLFDRFDIRLEWQEPTQGEPLDRIEAARARNNVNWMTILRIALEKSPQAAGPVVAEIRALDQEITSLTHDLMARLQDDEDDGGVLANHMPGDDM